MNAIDALNKVISGWTSNVNGMLVNSINLDIIDIAPATGEWFIVTDFGVYEGFATRDAAVEAYIDMMGK